MISYSGETQELKNVIQFANRNRITIIGIVSNKNSTLYKASDIKIYIPEVKEAGHGIVPTSSTTSAMAMGTHSQLHLWNIKNLENLTSRNFIHQVI